MALVEQVCGWKPDDGELYIQAILFGIQMFMHSSLHLLQTSVAKHKQSPYDGVLAKWGQKIPEITQKN